MAVDIRKRSAISKTLRVRNLLQKLLQTTRGLLRTYVVMALDETVAVAEAAAVAVDADAEAAVTVPTRSRPKRSPTSRT